jgi:hypothetical protein
MITLAFVRWGVAPTVITEGGHSLDSTHFGTLLADDVTKLDVGDAVIYPQHGVGRIVRKERKTVLGKTREYFTVKIMRNDMTVIVPVEMASEARLTLGPAFESDARDSLDDLVSVLVASPDALRNVLTIEAAGNTVRMRAHDEGWDDDLSYFVGGATEDSILPVEQSPVTSTSLKTFAAAGGGALSVWLTSRGVVGVLEGGAGIVVLYTSVATGDLIQRLLGSVGPQANASPEEE